MPKKILFVSLFLLLFPNLKIYAQDYDIFVDIDNSGTQDGSEANPFDTIGEALSLALSKEITNRKIFINNGEYLEDIELIEGVELFGEDKNNTIINGDGNSITVRMQNDTALENLKIYKGSKGISINKNSKVSISQVTIQETRKIGINIEESTKKRSITIKDSDISKNNGKGIYIKKGNYAKIYDNKIYDNEEEGIDVRSSAKGSIKNNKIYKNGEGGIELIVERSKMDIDKNKIYENSASGIALQAYQGGLSSVSNNGINKNKITSNKQYGIECDTPSKLITAKPILWSESATLKGNTITGNKKGIFTGICHFKTY